MDVKLQTDEKVLKMTNVLNNEAYFSRMLMPIIYSGFEKLKIDLEINDANLINTCVANEYVNEYQGVCA
jgi:type I restriction enzyme R subunit